MFTWLPLLITTMLQYVIQNYKTKFYHTFNSVILLFLISWFVVLVWDNVKRYRFNFYWWDATTFLPYQEETSYESSLLVQHSGVLALSSLQSVFASLTDRAKEIFNVLLQYQMEHGFTSQYQGNYFVSIFWFVLEIVLYLICLVTFNSCRLF